MVAKLKGPVHLATHIPGLTCQLFVMEDGFVSNVSDDNLDAQLIESRSYKRFYRNFDIYSIMTFLCKLSIKRRNSTIMKVNVGYQNFSNFSFPIPTS